MARLNRRPLAVDATECYSSAARRTRRQPQAQIGYPKMSTMLDLVSSGLGVICALIAPYALASVLLRFADPYPSERLQSHER
jgi:hypothetical protein